MRCNQFREDDSGMLNKIKNGWYNIGQSRAQMRNGVQSKYCEKRRRRVDLQFLAPTGTDWDFTQSPRILLNDECFPFFLVF